MYKDKKENLFGKKSKKASVKTRTNSTSIQLPEP